MSDFLSFPPGADAHNVYDPKRYHDALITYQKDVAELHALAERLLANSESVIDGREPAKERLPKLKTINAQQAKVGPAWKAARAKYDAAIDALDAAQVQEIRGLCAYAMGIGRGGAGIAFLLEECKAYDAAKGDYKVRKSMHKQICEVVASVADSMLGVKPSSVDTAILDEYERLEGEDASFYYKRHRDVIASQLQARQDSQNNIN